MAARESACSRDRASARSIRARRALLISSCPPGETPAPTAPGGGEPSAAKGRPAEDPASNPAGDTPPPAPMAGAVATATGRPPPNRGVAAVGGVSDTTCAAAEGGALHTREAGGNTPPSTAEGGVEKYVPTPKANWWASGKQDMFCGTPPPPVSGSLKVPKSSDAPPRGPASAAAGRCGTSTSRFACTCAGGGRRNGTASAVGVAVVAPTRPS